MQEFYWARKTTNTAAYYLFILLLIGFFFAPQLWLVTEAFDPNPGVYMKFFKPTLANFVDIFAEHNAALYLKNTVILAVESMLFTVLLVVMGGYALSRLKVPEIWIVVFWVTAMIPLITFLIPYYKFFRSLGLLNTILGCAIVFTVGRIPFYAWMMKDFFDTFPKDLEEAAAIDGANRLQVFLRVVIPLSLPPIGLIAAMTFSMAWGDLLAPMVLLNKGSVMPLSVGMLAEARPAVAWEFLWNLKVVTPFSIIHALPPVLLFIFARKYMKGFASMS